MGRRRPFSLRWAVRVGIVVVAVLFAWQLAGFHVTESRGAITAAKAKSITGLTLPPQATNIRAAGYRQWIEYAMGCEAIDHGYTKAQKHEI